MRACCKTKSVIPSGRASAEVLQNEKGVPKWHKIKMSLPEEDRIALESKNPVSSSFPDVTKQARWPCHTEKSNILHASDEIKVKGAPGTGV
jgi:hypothetical protein